MSGNEKTPQTLLKPRAISNVPKRTRATVIKFSPALKKKNTIPDDNLKKRMQHAEKYFGKTATTMTGLPWSVRHNRNPSASLKYPEKKVQPERRPRMGTYTYTYGENEKAQPAQDSTSTQEQPVAVKQPEVEITDQVKHFLALKSGNNILARTGSGYSPSMTDIMKQTGNHLSRSESTKDLLDLEALWDEMKDDGSVKESESVTPSEVQEASKAFELPGPSSKPLNHDSNQFPSAKKGEQQKAKKPQPTPEIFQQSYRLLPHIQEKLIEDQVKREFASKKIPPIGFDYIKRKQELMKATLKTGYKNRSSENVFPNLIEEYNFNDLFKNDDSQDFELLKIPKYNQSQENPRRHIQTLSPPMLDPKDVRLRQRHKESIVGTILREIDQSKNQLGVDYDEEDDGEVPHRKRTKDQERNRHLALKALENYRIIQERQKAVIHRVPEVTVGRPGTQFGENVPRGSQYHQMALSRTHRSHRPQEETISRFQPQLLTDFKNSMATTLIRRNEQFSNYKSHGLPPPPPPISDTIFPGRKKHRSKGERPSKKGKKKTSTNAQSNRDDSYADI